MAWQPLRQGRWLPAPAASERLRELPTSPSAGSPQAWEEAAALQAEWPMSSRPGEPGQVQGSPYSWGHPLRPVRVRPQPSSGGKGDESWAEPAAPILGLSSREPSLPHRHPAPQSAKSPQSYETWASAALVAKGTGKPLQFAALGPAPPSPTRPPERPPGWGEQRGPSTAPLGMPASFTAHALRAPRTAGSPRWTGTGWGNTAPRGRAVSASRADPTGRPGSPKVTTQGSPRGQGATSGCAHPPRMPGVGAEGGACPLGPTHGPSSGASLAPSQ